MVIRRPLALAFLVVAGASLLAAGCGGGGASPRVATIGTSTTATTTTAAQPSQNALVAFSSCMRSHGVASFPDPQHFAGGNVKLTINRLQASSPNFGTAMSACNHLLPARGGTQDTTGQTRTELAAELSVARCMRRHGVSNFPDPNAQSGLTVAMVQAQGIDVRSPAVLRVVQTCLPASHGALTIEKVREAIAHAG